MVSNKKRLYIALYPSGVSNNEERRYHWGFLTGPKTETRVPSSGMRYHVKNLINKGWVYEEREVRDVQNTTTLLARITIAKIVDEQRLVDIIRTAPVIRGDANWRCRTWVAEVLSRLAEDGAAVGSAAELNWEKIESVAREYVGRKTVEGRYERGSDQAQADVGHASRARDGVLILAGTQRCVVLA